MKRENYDEEISKIVESNPRFRKDAYYFVADAVGHTSKVLQERNPEKSKHISGRELLEGIREYALQQFGPLALDVLNDWGVRSTEDFGTIVFTMVEHRLLGASEEDSPRDFADGYDFREAFVRPFVWDEGDRGRPRPIIA